MPRQSAFLVFALLFGMTSAAVLLTAQTYQRNIAGNVTAEDGEPMRGAGVQLKDLTSLQVRSYITQADGKYRFCGLYTETDYEVRVWYRGILGRAKRVSRLNSHNNVEVNFRIQAPDQ